MRPRIVRHIVAAGALLAIALLVRLVLEVLPGTPAPASTPIVACTPGIDGCPMSGER